MPIALGGVVATLDDGDNGVNRSFREPRFAATIQNWDYLKTLAEKSLEGEAVVDVEPTIRGHDAHSSTRHKKCGGVKKQINVHVGEGRHAKLRGSTFADAMFADCNCFFEILLVFLVLVVEELGVVVKPIVNESTANDFAIINLRFIDMVLADIREVTYQSVEQRHWLVDQFGVLNIHLWRWERQFVTRKE